MLRRRGLLESKITNGNRVWKVYGATHFQPPHKFRENKFVGAGQIVPVEIDLLTTGLIFHAGETLRLSVVGNNLAGTVHPVNTGSHIIHTRQYFMVKVRRSERSATSFQLVWGFGWWLPAVSPLSRIPPAMRSSCKRS